MKTLDGQPIILPKQFQGNPLWGAICQPADDHYEITFYPTKAEAWGIHELNTAYPCDQTREPIGKIVEVTEVETLKVFLWLFGWYVCPSRTGSQKTPHYEGFPHTLHSEGKVALTAEDYLLLNGLVSEREGVWTEPAVAANSA